MGCKVYMLGPSKKSACQKDNESDFPFNLAFTIRGRRFLAYEGFLIRASPAPSGLGELEEAEFVRLSNFFTKVYRYDIHSNNSWELTTCYPKTSAELKRLC